MCFRDIQFVPHYERRRASETSALGEKWWRSTKLEHEMWLISLENLLMLYGEKSHGHVMEVHQELKRQNFLTPWCNVPADSEIIFVSTHWVFIVLFP